MNRVYEELRKVGVFYVATVDGDKPCVRPFGAISFFENNLYICTNNTKDVYKQMINNSNIEIAGCYPTSGEYWLRIKARVVRDERDSARAAMFRENPGLRQIYSVDDGRFEVFKLEDVICLKRNALGEEEKIF